MDAAVTKTVTLLMLVVNISSCPETLFYASANVVNVARPVTRDGN